MSSTPRDDASRYSAAVLAAVTFLFVATPPAWATNVGELINTNTSWALADSPFIVTSTISLDAGATLTIESGVEVRFNANTGIIVETNSILKAQGTAAQPIRFTSNNASPVPGQWNGIDFRNTTPASVLDHCIIEYGGAGGNPSIRVGSSTPTIRNSMIRFGSSRGIVTDSSAPIMDNNTITNHGGIGVFVGPGIAGNPSVKPVFQNNSVNNNGAFPLHIEISDFPVPFGGNTYAGNDTQAIELVGGGVSSGFILVNEGIPYRVITNHIQVNPGFVATPVVLTIEPGTTLQFASTIGLKVGTGSWLGVLVAQGTTARPITFTSTAGTPGSWQGIDLVSTTTATILDHCVIQNGGAGGNDANLRIASSAPMIQHCTIQQSDGAGIRLTTAQPVIEFNTISANNEGLVVSDVQGLELIRHNNITGNTLRGVTSLNATGVDVRLNWWGNNSGPSGIGPGSGNAISGSAVFEPWLGGPFTELFRWKDAHNTPDPFSQTGGWTTFRARLPEAGNWSVRIKDATNTVVKTFSSSSTLIVQDWFGDNDASIPLVDGIYTYELAASSQATAQAAATAVGRVTLNATLPVAHITAPGPNQIVAGTANIIGTAGGMTFSSYKVEFGTGVIPTSWTQIAFGTTPVANGVLTAWNTTNLTDSIYTLRLTVTSTTSQTAAELVTVRLMNLFNLTDVPDPFSPNGDGVKDVAFLRVRATLPVDWVLTLTNSANVVIKTFVGTSIGAGQLIEQTWNGTTDAGNLAPDDVYTYQFQATVPEDAFTLATAPATLTLDTTPPTALIDAPTEGQTILSDNPYPIQGTADDATFDVYDLFIGVGSPPGPLGALDTNVPVPVDKGTLHTLKVQQFQPNTYTLRLIVKDKAGNQTTLDRVMTLDHLTITNVSTAPIFIDPHVGEAASIQYTLNRPADVTMRIYHEPTKQLIRTVTLPGQVAGGSTITWDGRNEAGTAAQPEAYYFTLEARDSAGRDGNYNDAVTPTLRPFPETTNAIADTTNFDPYKNDVVTIKYDFSMLGRLSIFVEGGGGLFRRLLNRAIQSAGSHTELWDGRRDDGTIHAGLFRFFFDAPERLPVDTIVIRDIAPRIENFRAEAYMIHPIFSEVSVLTYTLTKNTNVTIALVDPNGNTVRTLLNAVFQTAGPRTVEWDGRTNDGKVVSVEGDYSVTLAATDPVSGQTSTRIGTIVVYK